MSTAPTESFQVRLTASRPPRHRRAIVFCCDQNYLAFASHAAAQIASLVEKPAFDICICYGQQAVVLPESLAGLGIRLCHIDVGDVFDGLRLDKGKTHDVYLRIALPTAFAGEYDKILYLDSDIFIQGGDFNALLDIDVAPHCIASVRDNVQWRTPNRQNKRNTIKGIVPSAYFNAGIMLMDVHAYTEQELMRRCIEFGRARRQDLKRHDQNLYNAVLQNDWAEISPVWNWQYSWSTRLFAVFAYPNIIHFIGPAKPWKDQSGQFEPRFADSFARFIRTHFPDSKQVETGGRKLAPDSMKMTKMLIKHLISARKIARFLSRFPDELTVHR